MPTSRPRARGSRYAESPLAREPSDAAAAGATLLTWRLLAHGTERLARVPFLRRLATAARVRCWATPVAPRPERCPRRVRARTQLLDAALDAAPARPRSRQRAHGERRLL